MLALEILLMDTASTILQMVEQLPQMLQKHLFRATCQSRSQLQPGRDMSLVVGSFRQIFRVRRRQQSQQEQTIMFMFMQNGLKHTTSHIISGVE